MDGRQHPTDNTWDTELGALPPLQRMIALLDLDDQVTVIFADGRSIAGIIGETPSPRVLALLVGSREAPETYTDEAGTEKSFPVVVGGRWHYIDTMHLIGYVHGDGPARSE